ncbi:MAG: hypothetical protein J6Q74_03850 [Clostridia bacterium]|nr:hypothetical protein [Clostridia bacterium]
MSNLKIDIIYYKTASDFEMEFNLSGCCRMRMFKDKVDTPKGLVNALARDVSRSKIIIIVSDLVGENTSVSTTSKAIKLPLVELDKEKFGVQSTGDILLPKTAVPLVTKSGIYGGFIIENGPQSIIFVSSERTLRHEIMKTYVHNYVFDVGQLHAYQQRLNSDSSNYNHPAPLTENKPEQATTSEEDTQNISSKSTDNFSIDGVEEETPANDVLSDFDNPPQNSRRKSKRGPNIALLIIVILLLIAFGILAYYFVYLPLLEQPGVFTDGNGNVVTEFLNELFS